MFAEVLVEYTNKAIDKSFVYKIPEILVKELKVGMKVKIPFNNKIINGVVIKIYEKYETNYKLKEIVSITDKSIILNQELFSLANYLSEVTLCSKMSAIKCLLPSSLKVKNQTHNYNKYNTYIKLTDDLKKVDDYILNNQRSKKKIEIINYLKENKTSLKSLFTSEALNNLIKANIVVEFYERVYRLTHLKDPNYKKTILSLEQQNAVNKVNLDTYDTYLLHGVTGSGKTEVYMELIDKVLNNKKTALVLIPEISLTAQIIKRFISRFGNEVAIFNSALSEGEKYDEYQKIYNNEVKIVVGTRSAIFTPLKNIGLIVLDEEHSETYKQDSNPRYDTIDIAKYRASYYNCPLLLGSATPSLEAMARAKKGVYKLIEMKNRIGSSLLPKINIIDMKEEVPKKNFIISGYLDKLIMDRLNKKEQIILLLNRRGYSTIITCSSCGYTYKCPHCDISLTYHKTSNNLRCHYCGYTVLKDDRCPNCLNNSLSYLGVGTEKLENILKEKYPTARIIRMDVDTTQNKGSHEHIIDSFKNHEYDILLGTQMVSKGLDFPLVTLVGVINADASLNIPDFRSGEKTFALLSQVSGRAGRSNLPGEVVLQTYDPNNPYLQFVKTNNYELFYNYEMNFRKKLHYPPYYYLISILVTSKDEVLVNKEATKVFNYLKLHIDSKSLIYGPTFASIYKINNIYRMQIMIKYRYDNLVYQSLKYIDSIYALDKKVNIEICFNPNRM